MSGPYTNLLLHVLLISNDHLVLHPFLRAPDSTPEKKKAGSLAATGLSERSFLRRARAGCLTASGCGASRRLRLFFFFFHLPNFRAFLVGIRAFLAKYHEPSFSWFEDGVQATPRRGARCQERSNVEHQDFFAHCIAHDPPPNIESRSSHVDLHASTVIFSHLESEGGFRRARNLQRGRGVRLLLGAAEALEGFRLSACAPSSWCYDR